MSDAETTSDGTERCPECGGEFVRGKATMAYSYLSCVDCDYYTRIKTGTYHDHSDGNDRSVETDTEQSER